MKRHTLNIDVQCRDIKSGVRRDPCRCAIALSTSCRLKGAGVEAQFEGIGADHHFYEVSRDVEQFMNDFDEGRPVKPSRFTLVEMAL